MHEQTPGPVGVPVEDVALLIGADVHAPDEQLPVLHGAEAVLHVHLARPDGFYLRAVELNAGLEAVQDEIVVERLAVGGDLLDPLFFCHASHLPFTSHCKRYYTIFVNSPVREPSEIVRRPPLCTARPRGGPAAASPPGRERPRSPPRPSPLRPPKPAPPPGAAPRRQAVRAPGGPYIFSPLPWAKRSSLPARGPPVRL